MATFLSDDIDFGEDGEVIGFECYHIGIVSISDTKCQCMDCLRIWPKQRGFVSDWPEHDRG